MEKKRLIKSYDLYFRYHPNLETIDSQGKSILYICCQSKDSRCFYKIIQEHPKFSKKVMDSRASDQSNAVIVACKQGNSEQLKYLLDNGVKELTLIRLLANSDNIN